VAKRPFTIVCVARLIERKGQHHLLQAFAQLRASLRLQPVRLLFVGTGDAETAIAGTGESASKWPMR
jgi:glycosyltransferase involved in cell wall biosynthesis